MEEKLNALQQFVEASGTLAPILFMLLHVIRQFTFIPVGAVCMAGGLLFGGLLGTIYSASGLLLSSIIFYFFASKVPWAMNRLMQWKLWGVGAAQAMTVGQIAVLRLFPFIHYHMMNVVLLKKQPKLGGFAVCALITSLPLAAAYTLFGKFLLHLTPELGAVILGILLLLFYLLRERVKVISWREFFRDYS